MFKDKENINNDEISIEYSKRKEKSKLYYIIIALSLISFSWLYFFMASVGRELVESWLIWKYSVILSAYLFLLSHILGIYLFYKYFNINNIFIKIIVSILNVIFYMIIWGFISFKFAAYYNWI